MKCPHCGSENVNLISNTTSRGFSGSNACCGTLLTGNCLGMLCGFCGSGKTKTKEFWICNNCGSKFQDKEIKRYNQDIINGYSDEYRVEETGYDTEEITEEVIKLSEPKTRIEKPSAYNGNLTADALLKRALIFIEDKEWEKACEYAEYALDVDAGCAEAYLAKFMAEYNIPKEEYIPELCSDMISEIDSLFDITTYSKASRFGDEELNKKLTEYDKGAVYNYAVHKMHHIKPDDNVSNQYHDIEKIFKRISGFKDSDQKAQECLDKAKEYEENAQKHAEKVREENYLDAVRIMENAQTAEDYITAMEKFKNYLGYSDSRQKYDECSQKIHDIAMELWENALNPGDIDRSLFLFRSIETYKDSKLQIQYIEENRKSRIKEMIINQIKNQIELVKKFYQEHKKGVIIGGCACLLIILSIVFFTSVLPKIRASVNEKDHSASVELMENKQYEESEALLSSSTDYQDPNDYKDSKESAEEAAEKINDPKPDMSNMGDVSIETNRLKFNGGYIEYTEYIYFDEYTKYTSFSAVAVIDGYPESENRINNALAQIGHIPSEAELAASKAPEEYSFGMMEESSTITQVYSEDNYLFITVRDFYDGGGGVSSSYWSEDNSYIFEITTGKQVTIEEINGTSSGSSSKLADIVGPGVYDYAPAPNITVDVSLADISRSERTEIINDLEYDINMHELLIGNSGNYFYNKYSPIGTEYGGDIQYFLLYDSLDTIHDNARNSFTENFISSDSLAEIMTTSGDYPQFMTYDEDYDYAIWCYYGPSPSEQYDYDNAGVVSYSETKAEVWIAYSSPIEGTFDVRSFSMIRNNANDQWKIDKSQEVYFNNGEITFSDSSFHYYFS